MSLLAILEDKKFPSEIGKKMIFFLEKMKKIKNKKLGSLKKEPFENNCIQMDSILELSVSFKLIRFQKVKMDETCTNESELFNQTLKTTDLQKFYFDGVAVSIFGILGLFGNFCDHHHQ